MKRKFWNWIKNDAGGEEERTLVLNGEISDETWYGDEVTPALFAKELNAGSGNITVWINSPGGDVYAAAQIYNMLMEYKGDVTVKVDALAASAASVIAMAGTTVLMSLRYGAHPALRRRWIPLRQKADLAGIPKAIRR